MFNFPRLLPGLRYQRARNCASASCVRLLSRVPVWNHPRPSLSLSLSYCMEKQDEEGEKRKEKVRFISAGKQAAKHTVNILCCERGEERREEILLLSLPEMHLHDVTRTFSTPPSGATRTALVIHRRQALQSETKGHQAKREIAIWQLQPKAF